MIRLAVTKARNASMKSVEVEWPEFVKKFLDVKIADETAAEFAALSKDDKLDRKDVGGYILGSFSQAESRKKEHFESRTGIALDCDHIEDSIHLAMIISKTKSLGFECVIASTRSHTPDNPRIRIIFPISRPVLDGDEYQALARMLASKIDIDSFDKTTFQAARLMFWNSCNSDVTPICEHVKGDWVDVDVVLNEYGDWRDCTQWPRTKTESPDSVKREIQKVEDPRDKPGLIGLFNNTFDVYQVIERFIPEVYGPGSTDERFSYLGGSSSNGAVVYEDGLFLYSHHESDPCYERCANAWDLVRLHKFGHLDDQASAKTPVSSLPSSIAMKDWARELDEIKDKAGDYAVATTAAQDFANVGEDELPIMSKDRWAYISHNDMFFDIVSGVEYSAQALNRALGRYTPEVMVSRSGRVLNNPREVSASDYLTHYLECPVVTEAMYYPRASSGVFEFDSQLYVNKFVTGSIPKSDPNWRSSGVEEIMHEYIYGLVPEFEAKMLIKYLAHNVQFPGKKIAWCPIVKGIPGDGKTTLAMIMAAALGRRNVNIVSTDEVTSAFNEWAHGSCLAVMEEIRVAGRNRHDVMNKLKPLITNDVISIIGKGKKGFNVFNTQNYLAFTNHEDALAIDENDRRWLPMFTHYTSKSQLIKAGRDKAYFARIYDVIGSQIGAIRGWLENVPLDDFNPHEAPATNHAKQIMIDNSRSDAANAVINAIELEGEGVCENGDLISTQHLRDSVSIMSGINLAPRSFSKALSELGYVKLHDTASVAINGRRTRLYAKARWIHDNDKEEQCTITKATELLEKSLICDLLS